MYINVNTRMQALLTYVAYKCVMWGNDRMGLVTVK